MSKEISFRAWTGKTMMYQDQQYLGSFLRRVVMQITLEHDMDTPKEHESYLPKGTTIDDYLLQYTGLVDRNGKKIYEGDIVKRGPIKLQVKKMDFTNLQWIKEHAEDFEVIGNTHENPDLLTPIYTIPNA